MHDPLIKISVYMHCRSSHARYEFTIGSSGNTKSSIFKYNDNNEKVGGEERDSEGVLDCNAIKPFYMTWDNGHLSVRGHLNNPSLSSHNA